MADSKEEVRELTAAEDRKMAQRIERLGQTAVLVRDVVDVRVMQNTTNFHVAFCGSQFQSQAKHFLVPFKAHAKFYGIKSPVNWGIIQENSHQPS